MADFNLKDVESSYVSKIGYHPESRTLRVRFRDRLGKGGKVIPGVMCDIPDIGQEDFESLMAAVGDPSVSVGRRVRDLIRGMPYTRVEETGSPD